MKHLLGPTRGGLAASVLLTILVGACAQGLEGKDPPEASFYHPMGLASSPDGALLYVVSSNFDLRFNAGWVSTVDVDALIGAIDGGADPRGAIVSMVRVPPLCANIDVDASGTLAVLACRGGMPLTLLDVAGESLTCGDDQATAGLSTDLRKTDCDRDHFTFIDPDLVSGDIVDGSSVAAWELEDPYATKFFARPDEPGALFAAVSYLSSGRLSLFGVDAGTKKLDHLRLMRPVQGAPMQALAVYPSAQGAFLAGANRSSSTAGARVLDIDAGRSLDDGADRARSVRLFEDIGGSETTSIVFEPGGSRAFATVRLPDSVAMLNTRLIAFQEAGDIDGTYSDDVLRPSYKTVAALPISGRPSAAAWVPRAAGALLAVTAFDDDVLFLLDPGVVDLRMVRRFDNIAQGPFAMTAISRGGRDLIFITTFFDHSVVVVDVTAADPTDFAIVASVANEELQPDGQPTR